MSQFDEPLSVLFVCLGNICRSPTAQAVFEQQLQAAGLREQVRVDSAGTGDWHIGHAPDPRSVRAAARRGYAMEHLRARQVSRQDFHDFDYILAMDDSNHRDLKRLQPSDGKAALSLFLPWAPALNEREVPDPYYGGEDGFDAVLDLIEQASDALLNHLRQRL